MHEFFCNRRCRSAAKSIFTMLWNVENTNDCFAGPTKSPRTELINQAIRVSESSRRPDRQAGSESHDQLQE
jgi:hypothetical protein